MKKDLAIAYRLYPGVSKTPFIHADNKLKLSEAGLISFKKALEGVSYHILFILDNCPPAYKEMILRHFDQADVSFEEPKGIGNFSTFKRQIEWLLTQDFAEYVYFAEDDYIYVDGAFSKMLRFMREHSPVDFISAYDHPDAYEMNVHRKESYQIKVGAGHHWRTNSSTCLTFMSSKQTLKQYEDAFMSFCKGNWDSSLWYSITKYHLRKPWNYIHYLFTDIFTLKTLVLAWLKTPATVLFKPRAHLWQPMPSLATHMERESLAPNVDWQKYVSEL